MAFAAVAICFIYAGDAPPGVNEAHYWVKSQNFWDPSHLPGDVFASSGKAHAFFYATFGWLTRVLPLEAAVWCGRLIGWLMLAIGLLRLCRVVMGSSSWALLVLPLWITLMSIGHLAGEWVVGGIEAKVPAYGLVLLGLASFCDGRRDLAWVCWGAASAFHVLTGGWTVLAGFFALAIRTLLTNDRLVIGRGELICLVIGGSLSLLGLLPALAMSGDDPETALRAARTYTYFRIPHHLLPSSFPAIAWVRFSVLAAASLWVAKVWSRRLKESKAASLKGPQVPAHDQQLSHDRQLSARGRLAEFTVGVSLITLLGCGVGLLPAVAPDWGARWLRFYWFRIGDAMLPLVLAIGLCQFARDSRTRQVRARRRIALGLIVSGLMLFAGLSVSQMRDGIPVSVRHRLLGVDRGANRQELAASFRDWQKVCDWVRRSTPADEALLTPRHQQTFKWYAGREEIVNWKDVPQDADSLLEWRRRMREVYPVRLNQNRVPIGYGILLDFRKRYDVRMMVVDRRVVGMDLPLKKLYPRRDSQNTHYAVYELPMPPAVLGRGKMRF